MNMLSRSIWRVRVVVVSGFWMREGDKAGDDDRPLRLVLIMPGSIRSFSG
jgi:hypothetical protein